MKGILTRIAATCLLWVISQASFATTGLFFNVAAVGNVLKISTNLPKSYPSAGIRINTPGYSVADSTGCIFGGASGFICIFAVNKTTTTSIAINGNPGAISITLCLNGYGPVSCQNYSVTLGSPTPPPPANTPMAYITAGNSNVLICPINLNGTFSACVNSGVVFQTPRGISLNNTGSIAYVVNNGPDSVSLCHINADGAFSSCEDSGRTGVAFSGPEGIALNSASTMAYVSNITSNSITVCPINQDGTFGSCVDSGGDSGFGFVQPSGIAISPTTNLAYVVNAGNSSVYQCQINVSGAFGDCVPASTTPFFNSPVGIALSADGRMAYVTNNGNDVVSVCTIGLDGFFVACQSTAAPGTFNGPFGDALNANNTRTYVANGGSGDGGSVSVCTIQQDGTFGDSCINAGGGVDRPVFLALRDRIAG